jgi:hypothetical protein
MEAVANASVVVVEALTTPKATDGFPPLTLDFEAARVAARFGNTFHLKQALAELSDLTSSQVSTLCRAALKTSEPDACWGLLLETYPAVVLQPTVFLAAVRKDNLAAVAQLLGRGWSSSTWVEALKLASRFGQVATLRLLLAHPSASPAADDSVALLAAIASGSLAKVQVLLDDGRVDVSALGQAALRIAARGANQSIFRAILRRPGVDPNACIDALENRLGVLDVLLNEIPDNSALNIPELVTRVCSGGSTSMIWRLLSDPRVDPDLVGDSMPLFYSGSWLANHPRAPMVCKLVKDVRSKDTQRVVDRLSTATLADLPSTTRMNVAEWVLTQVKDLEYGVSYETVAGVLIADPLLDHTCFSREEQHPLVLLAGEALLEEENARGLAVLHEVLKCPHVHLGPAESTQNLVKSLVCLHTPEALAALKVLLSHPGFNPKDLNASYQKFWESLVEFCALQKGSEEEAAATIMGELVRDPRICVTSDLIDAMILKGLEKNRRMAALIQVLLQHPAADPGAKVVAETLLDAATDDT